MSQLQADRPATSLAGPGPLLAYLVLGFLQGLALWLLTRPASVGLFSGHPALLSASVHFAAGAPVAWYLLAGSRLRPVARAGVALAIAALLCGLAAHAAATSGDGREPFSFMLAAAALSYMLVVLVAGFDARRRWFDYSRLFEHGWRNVLLVAAASALTGILWILLWGAAFLLGALGVDTLSTLLKQLVVFEVLSSTAFAFFILQATLRGEALVALRKFWLTLNTWFLPLALVLAIVWVVALLAIGPQPLFGTRRAALLLFWFVALAVLFMNAAYQDGRAVPYGRWIARATAWAWLSVPVLAAVGLWALSMRVSQHGWSVDRLWAAVVGAMALVYGVGYSGSAIGRSRWMPTLENTNIVASLALAMAIVVFTGPVADFRRIAVDSQVSRLRSGQTVPAAFDFAALKREGGQWGRDALARLATDQALPAAVRTEAKARLAGMERRPEQDQDHDAALAALRNDVRILPSGAVPDPRLLDLLSRSKADWNEKMCLQDPARCALWIVDLDGDGTVEAILLREDYKSAQGTVYADGPSGWRREAELHGPPVPMADWFTAIETRSAAPVKPRWPDLQLGDRRYSVRPD
ncbi:MAG: hypothetical protein ACXWC6_08720 [Ramlibacter sp.]